MCRQRKSEIRVQRLLFYILVSRYITFALDSCLYIKRSRAPPTHCSEFITIKEVVGSQDSASASYIISLRTKHRTLWRKFSRPVQKSRERHGSWKEMDVYVSGSEGEHKKSHCIKEMSYPGVTLCKVGWKMQNYVAQRVVLERLC